MIRNKQKGYIMRVGVIGGGASGMMAAITAAGLGAEVTMIEHTARVGKKILSTGNGKCNFTNRNLSKDDFKGNHPSFAEPVLALFDNTSALHFFEKCGMTVSCKRDGYYYPYSGQASTVLNTLRYQVEVHKISVETDTEIDRISKSGETFCVNTKHKKFTFDKIILACGGNAAPATGSDGSGYKFARDFGHKIIKPLPVLTYLKSKEPLLKELAGVRANAKITLCVDGGQVQTEEGELQLNKDNVSGIPVFQLSHEGIKALDQKREVSVRIDFIPHMEKEDLISFIEDKLVYTYEMMPVSEILCMLIHKKICGAVLHKCGISFEKVMCDLSRKDIKKISGVIKNFEVKISSYPGFENAQATMGGVDTSEIDENMMSKKVPGLYFAGEIVDIDGRCGGYNLQWAWSSGYVAGYHSVNGEVKCYESISVK